MLEFQNVSIDGKEKKILNDFTLRMEEGEILGLLGSDYRAKSMVLAAAGGGLTPDQGEILLDGASVYRGRGDIYKNFGYMPREYGFYDLLRVEEYFELFLSLYKVNGRYREKRVKEVAKLFGIEQYMGAFIVEVPAELLPFLCLAKTILHDPQWLLLDDPFAELSSPGRNAMVKILLMLQEQGKSMVINSQLFPETNGLFTDVAIIEEGKVVTEGKTEDVFETVMKKSPVRMHVLAGMEEALVVLKKNRMVDRVTVDEQDVIFRFNGGEKEEAELLTDLVGSGAFIQNYMRDRVNIEEFFRR